MTPPTIQWASVWQTHLGHADRQGGISDLGTRLVYGQPSDQKRILVQGKLEVAGNKGHEQAWKADHTVVPL